MKQRSRFLGNLLNKAHNKKIDVKVDVLEFEGDGVFYAYSPAFDLIGYGNTADEARRSWETILEEYFRYALNKNTLYDDLKNHGWNVKKKHHVQPPSLSWLLQHNDQLSDVYNKHNFQKITRPVSMPLQD